MLLATAGTICDADYSVGNVWGIWFGLYLFFSLLGLFLDNVLPVLTLLAVYGYRRTHTDTCGARILWA